ncbi:MAG: hypothetical protein LBE08_10905 [Bifidobacteriaceae bacterium]|jgi:hypothetical protein|nr:hypothetical protein [Bifidobacteriaceae bacterium]
MVNPVARGAVCGLVGAVVTLVACLWHRSVLDVGPWQAFPFGLIMALAAVIALGFAARAAADWAGLIGAAAGVFVAAQASALRGPGGDILIQGDAIGFIWIAGAPVLTLLVAVAPRAVFKRRAAAPPHRPEG